MSKCGSCKLVSQGKGRTALCYDCLHAERDKLREALRWTIEAIDITDWSRDGIEMLENARQLYLATREADDVT